MVSLDSSSLNIFKKYHTQGLRLSIVFAITKKSKVESGEGQIFKCSLHTNNLELEDELRLFR